MSDGVDEALKNAKNAKNTSKAEDIKPNIQDEIETNDHRLGAEDYKRREDRDDAKHSETNTKKLNEIYSFILDGFFGNKNRFLWWFIPAAILYILSSVEPGYYRELFPQYLYKWLLISQILMQKICYTISFTLFLLLTFPTAKGIRRLFRELIVYVAKK